MGWEFNNESTFNFGISTDFPGLPENYGVLIDLATGHFIVEPVSGKYYIVEVVS